MSSTKPVLVAGEWRAASNPAGAFSAIDPSTKTNLADSYPVSGADDIERACAAAAEAAEALRAVPREAIAKFLEEYATGV